MDISITNEGTTSIARLMGEIDANTARSIADSVIPLASEPGHIIIDMSGVTVMSSSGLRLLLTLYREVDSNDSEQNIVLCGLSDSIQDTMNVTGFLNFFQVYNSVEDALSALGN